MQQHEFNLRRFWAIIVKEFIQMRRDRMTFGMIVGIPLMQLILFGYAINMNPKNLPTAIYCADQSVFSRDLIWALKNSEYFSIEQVLTNETQIKECLNLGQVQFVVHIPVDFSRKLLRGEKPSLLLQADASDPAATSYALSTISSLVTFVFDQDLKGPLSRLRSSQPSVDMITHRHYNPEIITQYNIVPRLMGVELTMTMVIITSLVVTRERERGTMENLLATPVRPAEVMIGKIIPYITVGYIQVILILAASRFLFHVPVIGNIWLLLVTVLMFIAANLAVGITFSTIARNQLQAVQMSFFFFLPSLLLSGFMFPFRGMPVWAQAIGEVLPLTHFLRIVRGILLKGNNFEEILMESWQIALFMVIMLAIGIKRYRQTMD